MNHTLPPWNYDERPGIVAVYAGELRDCLDLPHDAFLFVHHFDRRDGGWKVNAQACADARLISAAPDMLRALLLAEEELAWDELHGKGPNGEARVVDQALRIVREAIKKARVPKWALWMERLVPGCRIRMGQTLATITKAPEPGFFYYKTDLGNKGYFDVTDCKLQPGDPGCPVEILDETLNEKGKESHV